jgi:hypothetical protein
MKVVNFVAATRSATLCSDAGRDPRVRRGVGVCPSSAPTGAPMLSAEPRSWTLPRRAAGPRVLLWPGTSAQRPIPRGWPTGLAPRRGWSRGWHRPPNRLSPPIAGSATVGGRRSAARAFSPARSPRHVHLRTGYVAEGNAALPFGPMGGGGGVGRGRAPASGLAGRSRLEAKPMSVGERTACGRPIAGGASPRPKRELPPVGRQ